MPTVTGLLGVKLAILVTVIVFDAAGLKKAYSHRDGGHPGHNLLIVRISQDLPVTKQHPCGPQAPTPHETTRGEGGETERTCGHQAVID